jgi:hypothetical protein
MLELMFCFGYILVGISCALFVLRQKHLDITDGDFFDCTALGLLVLVWPFGLLYLVFYTIGKGVLIGSSYLSR